MVLVTKSAFADWMEKRYLTWQMENGRASIRQFAAWLGTSHALVIQWMNDKARPGAKTLPIIADKLGPEVYDVLGMERPAPPEPDIPPGLSPEMQELYKRDLEEFTREWLRTHGAERRD